MNQVYNVHLDRYRQFIGREHFSCAVRLLGYDGIALCIREMLDIVTRNVCSQQLSFSFSSLSLLLSSFMHFLQYIFSLLSAISHGVCRSRTR